MARRRISLKRTSLIAVGCAVFLCSVGFARIDFAWKLDYVWPLALLSLLISHYFIGWKAVIVICLAFLIGYWRAGPYLGHLSDYQSMFGHKVVAVVRAGEDGVYGHNAQLEFIAEDAVVDNKKMAGRIRVSGFGTNAVYEGDLLLIEGKMKKGYGSSQASIGYAKITLLDRKPALLTGVRQKFSAGISSALPEPLGSFALGLLIGQRSTLSDSVKDDLRHVGLTHIIAVSGYNLTIILRSSERFFARHSRKISLSISIGLVFVFLAITGGAASIVRASIVSMLSIGAGYYGRRFKPLNLILLTAAITAFANPFYVWSDLGWYLSFLAFSGVLIIAPMLIRNIKILKGSSIVRLIIIETICAELMTTPLILHYFGEMTLVGLPSNVLVATLIPFAMMFSAIAGIFGMFFADVAGWFSWPAVIVLNFMIDMAHIIASLPNIFLTNLDFSMIQMLTVYILITVFVAMFHIKTKRPFADKITDKNNNI